MGVMAVTKYVEEDCLHANAWKPHTARECRNRSVTLNIEKTHPIPGSNIRQYREYA